MKFLDEVRVTVRAGKGGDGCCSFRREKFIEFGGPDGGNGGSGGNVVATMNRHLNTLVDFRYRKHHFASNGRPGSGSLKSGKQGSDCVLHVPPGTSIMEVDSLRLLADITDETPHAVIASGGRGGVGNACYKSSCNRAPRKFTYGFPGEEFDIIMRLKIFADVGLVGMPNAGKSMLLSKVSNACPAVAPYPFTTIHPVLGVVHVHNSEFILADIPGLIEGAHSGRGLGDRFLAHLERCNVLLYIIDATSADIINDYRIINQEIQLYGNQLTNKRSIIALNKIDVISPQDINDRVALLQDEIGDSEIWTISGYTGAGVKNLLDKVQNVLTSVNSGIITEAQPWYPL